MHVLCNFAMSCELPYTFEHIWTNLLTQCTQLPVAVFCCFYISGFPAIKMLPKFRKNQIKNQRSGSFPKSQEREGGHPQPARRAGGAAPSKAGPGGLLAHWRVPLV